MNKSILTLLTIISLLACRSEASNDFPPLQLAMLSADVYDKNYIEELPKDWEVFLNLPETPWYQNINIGHVAEGISAIKSVVDGDSAWKKKTAKAIMHTVSAGGYFARAYRHIPSNRIVIAHRGTDFPSAFSQDSASLKDIAWGVLTFAQDLDDDYNIFMGEGPDQQFLMAQNFVEAVKDSFAARHQTAPDIMHVGHSLGGVLAQLCALEDTVQAVTFDSPGCLEPAQKLLKQTPSSSAPITNYKAAPNAINSANRQCGQVIRLYPAFNAPKPKSSNYSIQVGSDTINQLIEYLQFTLEQHTMTGFFSCFDKTGYPIIASNQTDFWPVADQKYLGLGHYINPLSHPHWRTLQGHYDSKASKQQKGINIVGNDQANNLFGATGYNDSLFAKAGNDRLWGFGGNDILLAAEGSDTLTGGSGNDLLVGGQGDDVYWLNSADYGIETIKDDDGQIYIDGQLFETEISNQLHNRQIDKQTIQHHNQDYELSFKTTTLIIKKGDFEVHILDFRTAYWGIK
ncbi:MAG: hypothetical protein GY810_04755 [Aureispira sp.]|nr:hypothetical protein [Aureispira sp.]